MSAVSRPGRPAATTTMSALLSVRRQVPGAGVALGHGGVLAAPGQQQAERAADGDAAADDGDVRARDRHVVPAQQLDDALGRARQRPWLAEHQLAEVDRLQAVGVLVRVDQAEHALRVQAGRQRQLHDVAGAGRVGVQLGDRRPRLAAARRGRQVPADARRCRPGRSPGASRPRRTWLPGSSPTSTVPSPGVMPASASLATRPVSSSRMALAARLAVQNCRTHRALILPDAAASCLPGPSPGRRLRPATAMAGSFGRARVSGRSAGRR